jgi:hypothetical protein
MLEEDKEKMMDVLAAEKEEFDQLQEALELQVSRLQVQ